MKQVLTCADAQASIVAGEAFTFPNTEATRAEFVSFLNTLCVPREDYEVGAPREGKVHPIVFLHNLCSRLEGDVDAYRIANAVRERLLGDPETYRIYGKVPQ